MWKKREKKILFFFTKYFFAERGSSYMTIFDDLYIQKMLGQTPSLFLLSHICQSVNLKIYYLWPYIIIIMPRHTKVSHLITPR